jgi:hypothetical protein
MKRAKVIFENGEPVEIIEDYAEDIFGPEFERRRRELSEFIKKLLEDFE